MPELNLDTSTAVLYGEVDPDRYLVQVNSFSEVRRSKNKQERYVVAECGIIEGIETGDKFAGQNLWRNLMLEGDGAGFFIEFWNKCFPNEEDKHLETGDPNISVDSDEMIGKQLYFVVEEKERKDQPGVFRNEVTRVLPAT